MYDLKKQKNKRFRRVSKFCYINEREISKQTIKNGKISIKKKNIGTGQLKANKLFLNFIF